MRQVAKQISVDAHWPQQNVSAMAGFGVLIKFRFHYIHLSRGTGRNWSALTFRFAPLLRPPMPATAETPTLQAMRPGQFRLDKIVTDK